MTSHSINSFYDEVTATVTYVVFDPHTKDAIVIDPVLDYDPASSTTSREKLKLLNDFLKSEKLQVHYCLETHAHADHLSGAQELKKQFPQMKIAIGQKITVVQETFKKVYNLGENFKPDGSQFDVLLKDGEKCEAGSVHFEVLFTPGHTPACVSFLTGDAVFVGDALFMPDSGTGRCDFPDGSSAVLFDSITRRLYSLPDTTRVFVGHDYKANGTRNARWESTIGEEKQKNIHIRTVTSREEYCKMRNARDANLPAPRLLLASLQVNIDAGRLPAAEKNGTSYLKIPIR